MPANFDQKKNFEIPDSSLETVTGGSGNSTGSAAYICFCNHFNDPAYVASINSLSGLEHAHAKQEILDDIDDYFYKGRLSDTERSDLIAKAEALF